MSDPIRDESQQDSPESTAASDGSDTDDRSSARDVATLAEESPEAAMGPSEEAGSRDERDTPAESDPPTESGDSDATGSAVEDSGSENADAGAATTSKADTIEAASGEAPATVVDAPAADLEFNWYVLRVQSGREDTCSNALRKKVMLAKMDQLVAEIAVPKQKVTEIKDGKKRIRAQKLYPGYIFIHMALEDDLWYLIRDTSGIGDFVGAHQKPTPMTAREVDQIMSIIEEKEEAPQVQIDLVKNDMVKIKEGPFENFDGVVEEVQPSKGMVRVMVTIFGRATPVDLEYWQVEKL